MNTKIYTLYGIGAIMLWSTTIPLVKSVTSSLGLFTAAACIQLLGGVFGMGRILFSESGFKGVLLLPKRYIIGCSILFAGYMASLYIAIGTAAGTQIYEVTMINYLWPMFTILFSLLLVGKRASWILIPGTVLALSGMVLVMIKEGMTVSSFFNNIAGNPLVYVMALFAAVSWAIYSNLTTRWAGEHSGDGVAVFLTVSGLLLLIIRLCRPEASEWGVKPVIEMVFLSAATFIAYVLWDKSMRKGNVTLVSAISYLIPFFSLLMTVVYLDIDTGGDGMFWVKLWGGCGLLIAGSFISWKSISQSSTGVESDK